MDVHAGYCCAVWIRTLCHQPTDHPREDATRPAGCKCGDLVRVLAGASVWVRDHCPSAFEHDDGAPLFGGLACSAYAVRGDRVNALARQARHLPGVGGQDATFPEAAFQTRRVGKGIERVRVEDERTRDVLRQVENQAPRGTVAS